MTKIDKFLVDYADRKEHLAVILRIVYNPRFYLFTAAIVYSAGKNDILLNSTRDKFLCALGETVAEAIANLEEML